MDLVTEPSSKKSEIMSNNVNNISKNGSKVEEVGKKESHVLENVPKVTVVANSILDSIEKNVSKPYRANETTTVNDKPVIKMVIGVALPLPGGPLGQNRSFTRIRLDLTSF